MENTNQPNNPPIQTPPPTPVPTQSSKKWPKLLLLTLLICIVSAGSIVLGIQLGKKQESNQQSIKTKPTPTATQEKTITSISPNPKIEPRQVVEDVKDYLNVDKRVQITAKTFEWRNETNINGQLQCSDKPVTVAGYGFTVGNVKSFQYPDLTKIGYSNTKESLYCNNGAATLKGQYGYVIGNIVCVLQAELKTVNGPTTISFSCGTHQVTSPTSLPPKTSSGTDLTTNWKTYIDSTKGYVIKYPNDWYLYESPQKKYVSFSNKNFEDGLTAFEGIVIDIYDGASLVSLVSVKDGETVKCDSKFPCTRIREFEQNDLNIIEYSQNPPSNYPSEIAYTHGYLIGSNNKYIQLKSSSFYMDNLNDKIIYQILSTFTFTN